MSRGALVSLEGGEGAGKSSALACLRERSEARGLCVRATREPGGTPLGEALRSILLDTTHEGPCAESELLLMFAARAQLVRDVIEPALVAGEWVLSDRFTDASFAYQGGGRGQPVARIADLERWAAHGLVPDLTLLLDVPVAQGLARARGRGETDRFEREHAEFFERVRAAYRERAVADPERFRIIDASRGIDVVRGDVIRVVDAFLDTRGA